MNYKVNIPIIMTSQWMYELYWTSDLFSYISLFNVYSLYKVYSIDWYTQVRVTISLKCIQ